MGIIVAIGGGETEKGETIKIDKNIMRMSGKKNPRLLYISTASDQEPKCSAPMIAHFKDLGCVVSHLNLILDDYTDEEIHRMILDEDIIYVGGGDTIRLYHVFRSLHVDRYLREAYDKGVILSGASAGAMIWFSYGHTDSRAYYTKDWQYCRIPCLGFVKALLSPHFAPHRKVLMDKMYEEGESFPGVALENRTCLVIRDGIATPYRDDPNAKVHIYYPTASGYRIWNPEDGEKFDL